MHGSGQVGNAGGGCSMGRGRLRSVGRAVSEPATTYVDSAGRRAGLRMPRQHEPSGAATKPLRGQRTSSSRPSLARPAIPRSSGRRAASQKSTPVVREERSTIDRITGHCAPSCSPRSAHAARP